LKINSATINENSCAYDEIPYLINRLSMRLNKLWLEELRPFGLTNRRWQVLVIVNLIDDARISTITSFCELEKPVASRIVDQMQRDGLVKRKPSKTDLRVVEIKVTAKGRKIYNKLLPLTEKINGILKKNLGPKQAEMLVNRLSKTLECLTP
jgi:DNA-binding MarR family transcriptional regulator